MVIPEQASKLQQLVTAEGRAAIVAEFDHYRKVYGAEWLAQFKMRNPDLVMVLDLCANYEFADAYARLRTYIEGVITESSDNRFTSSFLAIAARAYLDGAARDIEAFHQLIRAEIDKPR